MTKYIGSCTKTFSMEIQKGKYFSNNFLKFLDFIIAVSKSLAL